MGLEAALKILCGKWWVASGADIHNTNSGNVGIGAAAPTARLHVREPESASIARLEGNGQGSAWMGGRRGESRKHRLRRPGPHLQ
jgi:hypothetical protein